MLLYTCHRYYDVLPYELCIPLSSKLLITLETIHLLTTLSMSLSHAPLLYCYCHPPLCLLLILHAYVAININVAVPLPLSRSLPFSFIIINMVLRLHDYQTLTLLLYPCERHQDKLLKERRDETLIIKDWGKSDIRVLVRTSIGHGDSARACLLSHQHFNASNMLPRGICSRCREATAEAEALSS